MKTMKESRREIAQILENKRVNISLARNLPSAADKEIRIQDIVLIYLSKKIKMERNVSSFQFERQGNLCGDKRQDLTVLN